METVNIAPPNCPVANYAFDVTPARLVTGLITERGVCAASREGLAGLYPEQAQIDSLNDQDWTQSSGGQAEAGRQPSSGDSRCIAAR